MGYFEDVLTLGLIDNPVPFAWGRPGGLAIAKDAALLISDEPGGVIGRVVYTGAVSL